METIKWLVFLLTVLCLSVKADTVDSLLKVNAAMAMASKVQEISDKYQEYFGDSDIQVDAFVEVPEPRQSTEGQYLLPFDDDGLRAEWAEKAMTAQAGAAAGGMVADRAAGQLASKVPFGGLFAGRARSKGKEMAAVTAIGGWDYIRDTSTMSFEDLDDYSVYMQMNHGHEAGYEEALAAAMAIYPDLETTYEKALSKAYRDANRKAKRALDD